MALKFMVWLGVFAPLAFAFGWLPLGSAVEAAALGLAASVALAAAVLVVQRQTSRR